MPKQKVIKSLDKIDKLVHEPARLTIMSHLYVVEKADFLFLKTQTGFSWGNLSSHLTKLEVAGYLSIKKTFIKKKPYSMVTLTKKGKQAFQKYQKTINGFLGKI